MDNNADCNGLTLSRRRLIAGAAFGLVCGCGRALAAPAGAEANPVEVKPQVLKPGQPLRFDPSLVEADFWERPRMLDLVRIQTAERVRVVYWVDGEVLDDAYQQLCHLLRDVRVNRSARMDPALLDTLWASQAFVARFGIERPLEVLSAYRTVSTNRKVGGAEGSLHTRGRAVDYRIPGLRPSQLAQLVRGFRTGGVGFYGRRSGGWVHADTGDPRSWRG
ncbi:MAG TPA: DUF882 domain-containing protein [Burkholderiaceae bacterium]|nr:DUF882 domain-containing protein [Burkholderiaceae bacterium]